MCGRYYVDEETEKGILQVVQDVDRKLHMKYGDVYPSDEAVIITGRSDQKLIARNMNWGFPGYQSSQLLINARSESVLEKKSFSDSVVRRRCIIPVRHFYEWDHEKNKVTFTWKNRPFYLAGFYNQFSEGERFIILTSAANKSVEQVHDRMPLIIGEEDIKEWIFDGTKLQDFLSKEQPELAREQEYEQLSLF